MATNDALDKIFAQLSNLTTHVTAIALNIEALKIENDNRIKEIQKITKGLGYSAELETDNRQIIDDNDEVSQEELEERAAIERQHIRNENIIRQQRNHQSSVTPLEEVRINAKLAVKIIKTINGQNDIGVEDFMKNVKRARDRCNQPSILLDLIISKRIQGAEEKAIRYTPITSYENLFSSLRLKIKQTGSVLALKSRLESCKQGRTETVQNFSIRLKLLVNELRYAIQSNPSASPPRKRG